MTDTLQGKLHVSVTRVRAGVKGGRVFKTQYINQFHSRDDLIDALCASCHLPYYSDGNFSCSFRGGRCVDGGMTNMVPEPVMLPLAPAATPTPAAAVTAANNADTSRSAAAPATTSDTASHTTDSPAVCTCATGMMVDIEEPSNTQGSPVSSPLAIPHRDARTNSDTTNSTSPADSTSIQHISATIAPRHASPPGKQSSPGPGTIAVAASTAVDGSADSSAICPKAAADYSSAKPSTTTPHPEVNANTSTSAFPSTAASPKPPRIMRVKIIPMPVAYMKRMMMFNKRRVLYDIAITADSFGPCDVSFMDMMKWSFKPGPADFLHKMEDRGRADALAWVARVRHQLRPLQKQQAGDGR